MPTRVTHADVNFPWYLSPGNPVLLLTNSWFLLYAASFDTYRADDSNTEHALSLRCPIEMEDKQLFWFSSNCFIAVYSNPRIRHESIGLFQKPSLVRDTRLCWASPLPSISSEFLLSKSYNSQWSSLVVNSSMEIFSVLLSHISSILEICLEAVKN